MMVPLETKTGSSPERPPPRGKTVSLTQSRVLVGTGGWRRSAGVDQQLRPKLNDNRGTNFLGCRT